MTLKKNFETFFRLKNGPFLKNQLKFNGNDFPPT